MWRTGSLLGGALWLAAFLGGCSCGDDDDDSSDLDGGEPDSGLDAGAPDAGDAGNAPDAGADAGPPGILDPTTIQQFVEPLVVPPVLPPDSRTAERTEYRIAARRFQQQMLPDGLPATTVFGYGRDSDPLPGDGRASSFHTPAFTIEARSGEVVRVTWVNRLVDEEGAFLQHILPIDTSLHWANPPDPEMDNETFEPYFGPVPIVTHLHGSRVPSNSDGHPDAWFLPAATDIPVGWASRGHHYDSVVDAPLGEAVFEYPNDQRAATLWYHDHVVGLTRLNVVAGLAGFWLVRDDEEDALGLPGPAPQLDEPAGTAHYEVPLAIQDRMFRTDGSLYYPQSREEFDGYAGPYVPDTPVPPVWNPEFFGNTMVVNGRTWPVLEVEPRLYRFRMLNGCNARFLILAFDRDDVSFQQVGSEGGLLADRPVPLDQIVMSPGERADVLVDLSGLTVGDEVMLLNFGPDEPFKGLDSPDAPPPADPETTGRVMLLRVVDLTGQGTPGAVPEVLPAIEPLVDPAEVRELTLNEAMFGDDLPIGAFLGTPELGAREWEDEITERPLLGSTEVWRIVNLTGDAHPIHLHLVTFQVLDRTALDAEAYDEAQHAYMSGNGQLPVLDDFLLGEPMAPEPWEDGWKDTVIANPGEVLSFAARFDLAGLYLWHCHILEHEDNEMMRPFEVVAP